MLCSFSSCFSLQTHKEKKILKITVASSFGQRQLSARIMDRKSLLGSIVFVWSFMIFALSIGASDLENLPVSSK